MGERASHVGFDTCLHFVDVMNMVDKNHKHAVTIVTFTAESIVTSL